MSTQKKVDKVLKMVRERVMEEVGSLLGVGFHLSESVNQVISKAEYFAELNGKKVVAKLDVTGEIEGLGAIMLSVKDAIRLGGTLIMLPAAELDQVVKNENYSEEIEDSYGEIANIIAGSYTKAFEDSFPKDCRFVRKEQDVVVPLKVDSSSTEPIPEQYYYWVRSSMKLDDQEMGEIDVLMPAEAFGIEIPDVVADDSGDSVTPQDEEESTTVVDTSEEVENVLDESEKSDLDDDVPSIPQSEKQEEAPQQVVLNSKEIEKKKKLIDKLLNSSAELLAEETGSLLGVDVKLKDTINKFVTKESFFQEETSGKQVVANMDIAGEAEGESFLFVSLKDAIRIGSILIMLPPSEMETAVNEEEFTEDCKDAYSEIANIISGSYTTIFQDQYSESLRFIKKDTEVISPLKIDCDGDEIIPNQSYYLSMSSLEIGDKSCGNICLLLPADLFGLAQITDEDQSTVEQITSDDRANERTHKAESIHAQEVLSVNQVNDAAEILLIENNSAEADKIEAELRNNSIHARRISFNDSINEHLSNRLKLVIIVMQEVDEQAYGIAIKLRAMKPVPIVAAGSEWTRSRVIKAVKYGVTDILLTPSSSEEIREKVNGNMMQLAA
ncbi:MAG: hypothetical protein QNJ17_13135 [Desulfocapsaceae bacterium]|nr:hypothetical protein [Desulfocapsaceae bacterium]